MNYFQELLESYSRLKKRSLKLLEQEQLDPNAVGKADQYISAAKSAKNNPSPSNRIEVIEAPKTHVWIAKKTGLPVYNGFGSQITIIDKISDPEGYNKFVGIFSVQTQQQDTGDGAGLPPQGQQALGAPAATAALKYPWIGEEPIIDELLLTKFIESAPSGVKQSIPDFSEIINYFQTENVNKGFINTLKRTSYLAECFDNAYDEDCFATKLENRDKIQDSHKKNTLNVVRKALSILLTDKPLTLSEQIFLKNSISINRKGDVFIIDSSDSSGEGILLKNSNTSNKSVLHSLILESSKLKQLNLTSVRSSFLNGSISKNQPESTFRGFYYEDIQKLGIALRRCLNITDESEKNKCHTRASKYLEKYQESTDKVIESFRSLYSLSGQDEISISTNNATHLFFVNTIARTFGLQSLDESSAQVDIRKFCFKLTRLALLASNARRPTNAVKVGAEVGSNRKSDIKEFYDNREAAVNAVVNMGINRTEAERMVRGQEDTDPNSIGDSLKFSTDMKEVIAGRAALPNVEMALDPQNSNTGQIRMLRSFGIDEEVARNALLEAQAVTRITSRVQAIAKRSSYVGSDGKLTTVDTRDNFIKSLKSELTKNSQFNDEITSKLTTFLEDYEGTPENQRKSWEEVSEDIANTLHKAKLREKLEGSPREKERAIDFVTTMAVLGGCAVDSPFLTVVDPKGSKVHVTSQNLLMRSVLDKIRANQESLTINDKSISLTLDGNKVFQLKWDGFNSDFIIDMKEIEDFTKKDSGTGKTLSVRQGMEVSESVKSANNKLSSASMKLADMLVEFSNILKNQINN
jgi:hypothetical protein